MRSIAKAVLTSVLFSFHVMAPASALEREQAIENCRSTVGKPIVMACLAAGRGNMESCRASAGPRVKACVQSAMAAARPKAQLLDAAKISARKPGEAAADAAALASKAPASLVAPPRTIADLAAILDQQKPDAGKIAELTAAAEAPVPNGAERTRACGFPLQARAGKCAAWPLRRSARRRRACGQQRKGQRLQHRRKPLRATADAPASRGRAAQARQCLAVQTNGRICQARQRKAVRGLTDDAESDTSETATSTRRKAMPHAIVRCSLKRSAGRTFRSTARPGRLPSRTAMHASRKRAVGLRTPRPRFTRRRSFTRKL